MRAYAIGDIHGQIDLLHAAHKRVAEDRTRVGDSSSPLIHLGDLTDRGPASRDVVETLLQGHAAGKPWVTIKGNHDHMFSLFMANPNAHDPGLRPGLTWLNTRLGGDTTMASYGIENATDRPPADVHAEALSKIPQTHLAFLQNLPMSFKGAGAFFVHAGIRPGVPLERQTAEDMMWIRAEFHKDQRDHGALIVHGHTPVDAPEHHGNRVNIDTGAAYGGPLTAIVVEDGQVHVLTEGGRIPLTPKKRRFWPFN